MKISEIVLAIFCAILLMHSPLIASDKYYDAKFHGYRIYLTPSEDEILLRFGTSSTIQDLEVFSRDFNMELVSENMDMLRFARMKNKSGQISPNLFSTISQNEKILDVSPLYYDQFGEERVYVPGLFTVQFVNGLSVSEMRNIIRESECKIVTEHYTRGYYTLEKPDNMDYFESIQSFVNRLEVKFSEPDYLYTGCGSSIDDEFYTEQWNLNNTGQYSGTEGADINVENAWEITKGSSDVWVAVLEETFNLLHNDMSGRYKTEEGKDFTVDPPGDVQHQPSASHSSRISGIIAANHNSIGIRGIAPFSKIIPVMTGVSAIYSCANEQRIATRVDAIRFLGNKVEPPSFDKRIIITTSWTLSPIDCEAIADAVQFVNSQGIVFISATGNHSGGTTAYPSLYSEVIGVGATMPDDSRGGYSNYKAVSGIEISAPVGEFESSIISTDSYDSYSQGGNHYGTSFASPQVAGVVALMLALDNSLSVSDVRTILRYTADEVGGYTYDSNGWSEELGYGRLNAYTAVLCAKYDVQQYVTGSVSGSITQNTMFYGDVHVTGDLIVNSGVAVVIKPGTEMKFDSGKKLRVYGTLAVAGTETLPATFTRYAASGSWYGIRFENSSIDADSFIKHADIEYASYGVYNYYANPKIENSTFKNNTYGMYMSNSSPSVKTNEISQSSQHGIYMFGSDPYLFDNYIHNNSADGINGQFDSSPSLFNNSIKSNSSDGYYAFYYSSPEFGPTTGPAYGHNVVSGNGANGVYAYYYSNPLLGDGAPWSSRAGGYNTIENNTSYNVKAISTSDVRARYNWWGASPPLASKFYSDGSSSINTDFHLSSASASGSSLGKSAGMAPLDTNSVTSLYEWGREFWLADKLNESVGLYKMLIRKFPNTPEARLGVVKISYLYQKAEMIGLSAYLSTIINEGKDPNLVRVALDLLSSTYMKEREFDSAVSTNESILTRSPDTGSEYIALFNLFTVYRNELKDDSRAGEFLSILKAKYPDHELTFFAQSEMGEDVDWSLAKKAVPENISQAESISIPKEYNLGENYPNPFNPVTQIDFAVPEDGFTRLVIYDLRGREVVRLIEGAYSAGYHSVKWDGSSVASGLYFYRLQSGKFVQTKKMMLLK